VIAEHVYSSRFGTFIVDSEREREEVRAGSVIYFQEFISLQFKLFIDITLTNFLHYINNYFRLYGLFVAFFVIVLLKRSKQVTWYNISHATSRVVQ